MSRTFEKDDIFIIHTVVAGTAFEKDFKLCLRKVSFKVSPILQKNYDKFLIIVNEENEKRTINRLKDLNLFHVEGFVIEEEYSAVVGFIKVIVWIVMHLNMSKHHTL